MKRSIIFLFMALLISGCATAKSSAPSLDPKKEAMKIFAKSMKDGMEAVNKDDFEKASDAFTRAFRQLRAADEEGRTIITKASDQMKKIVDISGFEYAEKDAFSLLMVYLNMNRAYSDNDLATLKSLSITFNASFPEVQKKAILEKQKSLQEKDVEAGEKHEEQQKNIETAPETYPLVYEVKKGDTMPIIAGRHDIYRDPFMWPLIYKANRDQIKDPKLLYSGQNLKVPRDMSLEEIIEARKEAGAPDPDKIPKDAYIPKGKKR